MPITTRTLAVILITAAALTTFAAPPETPPASQPAADYAAEFQRSLHYAGPRTQENLDRLKKALAAPETRLPALRELIDFAGLSAYPCGSVFPQYPDGTTQLRQQAAIAAHDAADDPTILQALKSPDPLLTFWAIWHFRGLKDAPASLPALERIAQSNDETLRCQAIQTLRQFPSEATFVHQRAPTEKSPYVLDQILFVGNPAGAAAFNQRLGALLADPDPAVRTRIVAYIAVNHYSAAARQIFLDAPLMDALLARAQTKEPEAPSALDAFRTYANQKNLPDPPAAAAWWIAHRRDWELARFPRSFPPNGTHIQASILTTGQPGATPPWQASITLENVGHDAISINLAQIAALSCLLYDADGNPIPVDHPQEIAAPDWRNLKPGESVTQPAPIRLPAANLKPGRYTLHAWMYLGTDRRNLPPNIPLTSGELALPTLTLQLPPAAP